MAAVRTTAPRTDGGGKRKRKRSGKSKTPSPSESAVDAQLATLENWQRSLTIDMRELRREGLRVRREVEKVEDVADAAVEKAEQAAQAQAAKDEALQETKRQVEALADRFSADLARVVKKLSLLDKKLDRHKQESVNEDTLMAQLTTLQEQYENELVTVKEEHAQEAEATQQKMDSMETSLQKLMEENKRLAQKMTHMSTKQELSELRQKFTQVPTRQELGGLQEELRTVVRESHDEQARTRGDLNAFEDRLIDVDQRVGDADLRQVAPPMPPPPMPSPPRDLVRQGELVVIHDHLRRVNRDLGAVGVDFTALAKRIDGHSAQQDQKLESRLQELSSQLFESLNRDSRQHASEIRRLKDAIFDVQSDNREFGQRMRRVEDGMQQGRGILERPRSPRSPRDRRDASQWHRGPDQLPPPPPPHVPRNSFDRPSRYEEAPGFRGNAPPPPTEDRIRWAPRRRSRSRSPHRRNGWGGANNNLPRVDSARNGRRYQQEHRRYLPETNVDDAVDVLASSGTSAPASPRFEGTDSAPLPSSEQTSRQGTNDNNRDVEEQSQAEQPVPFRRSRQSRRRIPEVIVIEEDDEEEDNEEEAAPNRASPDVVMDEEEGSQQHDVIMAHPPDNTEITDHTESTDLLEREVDLQTGFLLYFCLGGAPDLDGHWTNCFSQLKADECVVMPRALRFQRRYSFLQSFPVYLTQCILQAVIINGQSVPDDDVVEASPAIGVLDVATVRNKFYDVVESIHLSWANALVHQLSKDLENSEPLATEELRLSMNPAGLSAAGDDDELIREWRQHQASAIWTLARELHYGSLLPPLDSNEDISPAVYLFALMFEVLTVSGDIPQSGTYRLNAFGGKLMAQLWNQTLKKLPYVFFADWSWLDDQSTKGKLPALGFCHLLASILLWNSTMDRYSLMNLGLYADVVNQLLSKLHVGGQSVRGSLAAEGGALLVSECESTHIEFLDIDSKFVCDLGLDGFFEVWEAIQKNTLAVPESASSS